MTRDRPPSAPEGSPVDEPSVLLIADERMAISLPDSTIKLNGRLVRGIKPVQFAIVAVLAGDPDRIWPGPKLESEVLSRSGLTAPLDMEAELYQLRQRLGRRVGNKNTGAIQSIIRVGRKAVTSLDPAYIPENKPGDDVAELANGRIVTNATRWTAICEGERIQDLTPNELKVLHLLASQPDTPLPLDILGVGRSTIAGIRKKLGPELGRVRNGAIGNVGGERYYGASSVPS